MTTVSSSYFVGVGSRNELFNIFEVNAVVVDGGDGNDYVIVSKRGDVVFGGLGNDIISANSDSQTLGGHGETLYGDISGDPNSAVGGNDQIGGGYGPDSIYGGGGDDFTTALFDNDTVFGGAGNDIVWGGNQSDLVFGGDGGDTLFGNGDAHYPVLAGIIVDYDGRTDAAFTPSDPFYQVPLSIANGQQNTNADDNAADTLYGGGDNDTIYGQGGDDVLDGGDGDDTIDGGNGGDIINGGFGDDLILPGPGTDAIDGGDGLIDRVDYGAETGAIVLTLDGSNAVAVKIGGVNQDTIRNVESIYGGSGNDRLTGDGNSNYLSGGRGKNTLSGAGGDDVLVGGTANDALNGGAGADVLLGDAGKNKFVYGAVSDSTGVGRDLIENFDAKTDAFVFPVAVNGLDAAVNHGTLRTGHFNSDLSAAIGNGQLGVGHAVLFTPDHGDNSFLTFLIVDANGIAGYQPGQDYVSQSDFMQHANKFGTGNFKTATARLPEPHASATRHPSHALPHFDGHDLMAFA